MDKPKVVILVEGGLVQDVITEVPMEVEILDFDTDGVNPENEVMVKIPKSIAEWVGSLAIAIGENHQETDDKLVNQLWAAIQQARK
jgi:hypothetical protein